MENIMVSSLFILLLQSSQKKGTTQIIKNSTKKSEVNTEGWQIFDFPFYQTSLHSFELPAAHYQPASQTFFCLFVF